MAFTLYQHTDPGAPPIDGLPGSLQAMLYACLVTGYGAKPAAGWTRSWLDTGGNKAIFKPNDPQDAFFYFHDDSPNAYGGREATFWMGNTHDAAGNLTNKAPHNLGYTAGWCCHKSDLANATARPWKLYADGKTAILFIDSEDYPGEWRPYVWGKAVALSPVEAFPWLCTGKNVHASPTQVASYYPLLIHDEFPNTYNGASTPFYADGAATALPLQCAWLDALKPVVGPSSPDGWGAGAPGPRTGILPLWDGLLVHDREPRLKLRGLTLAYSASAIADGDTFSATVGGVLRTFIQCRLPGASALLVETSDTLDL